MAHFFFDSVAYPWTFPEAKALWKMLAATFPAWKDVDNIRRSCDENIVAVAHGPPDDMWRDMLDNVAKAKQLKAFDAELRTRNAKGVVEALDKVIGIANPDSSAWLLDTPLFVNRVVLRAALAQLASPRTDKNVLIVRGDRQSGKSWTRHMVQ